LLKQEIVVHCARSCGWLCLVGVFGFGSLPYALLVVFTRF
jgi:hypothetical protein